VSCRVQPCSRHQVCNAQTGFCEADTNCVAEGCESGALTCDSSSGRCVPLPCTGDAGCPASFVCGAQGTCTTGCRPNGGACAAGQYCRVLTGESLGQCVPQCVRDIDCPFGQSCQLSDNRSTCQLEPPCQSSDDCRGDEICSQSSCTQPPCTDDSACQGSQVCNRSTGLCVGGDCTEDIFAPNHAQPNAATLSVGVYSPLTLCPGHADWFAIDVRSSDALRIHIEHGAGSDVDIYLFDQSGQLLALNQRPHNVVILEHVATRTQTLVLKITATSYAMTSYSLDVTLNANLFCVDDAFEENDTIHQATILPITAGSPTELPLRLCGFDEDWFVLPQLSASSGLHVRFRNAPADFIGRLLTPDGKVFTPALGESLRFRRLGVSGNYYLQARTSSGRAASYRMLYDVEAPWQCSPGTAHSTIETARQLEQNSTSIVLFCPIDGGWEVGWFALERGEDPGTIGIELIPSPNAPTLDFTLFELIDGQPVVIRAATRQLDGRLALTSLVQSEHPLLIRVLANEPAGRIRTQPSYQLSYGFEYLN
nr:hypothetical protein [Lujinxingiaceae bacterium]